MNLYKKYVLSFVCASIVASVAYYLAFLYQLGAPIPASYDLLNWIYLKENAAQNTNGQRILLVGDSNVVFGMDSPKLEKEIGRPVVNMSLHGGLPLDWLTDFAVRNVRSGDIVVMPLNWIYYFRDFNKPEDWMIDQIVAWDRPYFDSMNPLKKLRYISALKPQALYSNLLTKENAAQTLTSFPLRKVLSKQEMLAQYQAQNGGNTTSFSYSYLNMNKYGDMLNACGNVNAVESFKVNESGKVNKKVLKLLKETADKIDKLGAVLYVVPSVTVADSRSQQLAYESALNDILGKVRSRGVNVLGTPKEFYYPPEAFFDTIWHLNCAYSGARTMALANILKPVLTDSVVKSSVGP